MKPIAVGSDDAGFPLKEILKGWLEEQGYEVQDFGAFSLDPVDYPDVAVEVARAIAAGRYERGVLICGTGIGMSITANKVRGVRAALAHDTYSAERARKSNDAQILTMGSRVIGPELAKRVLAAWLDAEFAGGPSKRKVEKIKRLDSPVESAKESKPEISSCRS